MLLCNGSFYGTLAAARALGREGVPVAVVDPSPAAPALWSRHVARRLRCPPFEDADRFAAWLLALGRREPRHVLYATSDELSFVLALHRDELSERFALYQPDLETMMGVLDKGRLLEHARAAGLDVPETWLPETEADVERVAREAGGALLVKPRTQATLGIHTKGLLVEPGGAGLVAAYARFLRKHVYGGGLARRFPEATRPMIQRYHPEAADGIYSISGFRDRTGKRLALLGATKVLQRPRQLGVGLCFEAAAVDPALAAGIGRLCDRLGYHGVFEIEFILSGGRAMLIDMNPRFYGQMGLDIARGLLLPQLAYAAALGDDAEVARLVDLAPRGGGSGPHAYCNRLGLDLQVGAQRLFGSATAQDAARWRAWRASHGPHLVDAIDDPDDRRPFALEIAGQLFGYLRHPRSFIRFIARGG